MQLNVVITAFLIIIDKKIVIVRLGSTFIPFKMYPLPPINILWRNMSEKRHLCSSYRQLSKLHLPPQQRKTKWPTQKTKSNTNTTGKSKDKHKWPTQNSFISCPTQKKTPNNIQTCLITLVPLLKEIEMEKFSWISVLAFIFKVH